MTFTASDVLLKAASRIEEEGMWCQGRFFGIQDSPEASDVAFHFRKAMTQRVPECAIGAMISAATELNLSFREVEEAIKILGTNIQLPPHTNVFFVGQWNDTPGRSAAEVAEAMRRAAL